MTRLSAPLVSADSHFLDPPDLWQRHLSAKFLDRAPRLVEDRAGGHAWLYAGQREAEPIGLAGLPGREPNDLRPSGVRYEEVRKGTYDGAARIADQDEDGVSAEVIFPTSRPLAHFLDDPDREFVLAGVEAYNRFVIDEFCAAAPGRLFAVAALPTTGVDDCIDVLTLAADRGFVAAVLPSWPSGDDHMRSGDAKFWRCAEELGMPICIHVSLRSREERLLLRELHEAESADETNVDTVLHQARPDDYRPKPLEYHHRMANPGLALGRGAAVLSDLLMSGIFDAYPGLRVGLIETWVGWIPRALDALDDLWRRNRYIKRIPLEHRPSHYWTSNMMASFLDDRLGIAARHMIGVDKMMWSSDYPHFGTFWPHSRATAEASIGELPAAEQALILSDNCLRLYNIADRVRL